jgi:hypothetical protein
MLRRQDNFDFTLAFGIPGMILTKIENKLEEE